MAESLPYLAAPGMITKCLEKISHAATPEKVTGDFVNTKLGIKGGAGRALVPLLKKIGFVNSDGTPTTLYKRFRNPAESEQAVAEAIKVGYKPLYLVNEYCHELNESELKSLIVQVTGQAASSNVVRLTVSTFQNLRHWQILILLRIITLKNKILNHLRQHIYFQKTNKIDKFTSAQKWV
jgi:hypothetical protein